jgi:hypothetical protein
MPRASPPFTGHASADRPVSAAPVTGQPVSVHPVSATPISGSPRRPVSGPPDPIFDVRPSWEPRIVPSPPPQRGKLVVGLLAGLVAGLLVFGGTGYFVGRATAPQAQQPVAPTPTATSAGSIAPYQAAQRAANTPKFPAALQNIAEPWLPWMGSCLRNGQGKIKLQAGEKARVRCQHGDVVLTFVEYASIAERDKVRIANLSKNIDARQLTPGVAAQREGATPSGRMTGDYVEYAYTLRSGRTDLPVAALWWDDASAPVGAYMIAFWKDKLGGSWDPLRDLWAQHA